MLKIACYGVRPNEVTTFEENNKYNYDLTLYEELLTHDNIETAKGHDAVLLRANCVADRKNLEIMKDYGIDLVFTRTVGFNHIDLDAAKDLGQKVARVPGYSPNAIAELAVTMAMTLLRNVQYTADRTSRADFRVTPQMFSREIRNCTVGIIGTGRIGLVEAQMYKAMGARVLGYDVFQSDAAKEVVEFVEQDELLAQSDIVSMHVPHIPGENDEMINKDFLSKMCNDAILVNTARAEIQDTEAIVEALKNDELYGYATDVIPNEGDVFFKSFDSVDDIPVDSVRELTKLYPKAIITPHVGSNTDEAVKNMVEYSFDNFNDVLETGTSDNLLF
ncbi:lactate dehydrogenase [Suicoccus acidiformans]|uniref:Lactate dehydrogenase n=1 Tax=Suicoccus acidiformans TaxID=2036206 RepID=A0A347WJ02_9LACT|nr:2-hydroxyacid dehydrogenase [Suicoccus acidiformans]AXY25059.1 lactate dehydrogenase [Suicoccus acidiformans]